jgi:translation initiation factor IF-2
LVFPTPAAVAAAQAPKQAQTPAGPPLFSAPADAGFAPVPELFLPPRQLKNAEAQTEPIEFPAPAPARQESEKGPEVDPEREREEREREEREERERQAREAKEKAEAAEREKTEQVLPQTSAASSAPVSLSPPVITPSCDAGQARKALEECAETPRPSEKAPPKEPAPEPAPAKADDQAEPQKPVEEKKPEEKPTVPPLALAPPATVTVTPREEAPKYAPFEPWVKGDPSTWPSLVKHAPQVAAPVPRALPLSPHTCNPPPRALLCLLTTTTFASPFD